MMNAMIFICLCVDVCLFTEMGDTLEFNDIHTESKGSWVGDAKLSLKCGVHFYYYYYYYYIIIMKHA